MGRKIPQDEPLSDRNREFLMARDRWAEIRSIDEAYPPDGDVAKEPDPADGHPDVQDPRTGQTEPTHSPTATHQTPAAVGQRQRLAAMDPNIRMETEDHPYEDWHNKTLRDETHRRGVPSYGNKQALVDRLRGWDDDHEVGPRYEDAEPGDRYSTMNLHDLQAEAEERNVGYDTEADDDEELADNVRDALREADEEPEDESEDEDYESE